MISKLTYYIISSSWILGHVAIKKNEVDVKAKKTIGNHDFEACPRKLAKIHEIP